MNSIVTIVCLGCYFTQKRCTPTHPQTKRFKAADSDGEGQGATPAVLRKGQTRYFSPSPCCAVDLILLLFLLSRWEMLFVFSLRESRGSEGLSGLHTIADVWRVKTGLRMQVGCASHCAALFEMIEKHETVISGVSEKSLKVEAKNDWWGCVPK